MGFTDVYDFVSGKADWIAHRLPVEGNGPHFPLVGEVARREIVHECRLGSKIGESRIAVAESRLGYCVVLNDQNILLGRLRRKHLQSGDEGIVENVMEPGPSTVRPTESAAAVLRRMKARDVPAVLVTTAKGKFFGIARKVELERLVRASEGKQYAGQERRR
jgi:CBS domain-containing protein